MENINNEHDVGYGFLLSTKQVFLQLLESFVNKGWVDRIDASELELVDKSLISQEFEEKEADLVYKVKIKDQEVIFYTLMELQSTVDYRMPYRLLIYMTEIWREIIKNYDKNVVTQKSFRLPVIVPIVLYNGKYNWNVPLNFKDMLNQAAMFEEQVLNFEYILIDVKRYDQEHLLQLSNLISTVFLLDQDAEDIGEFLERLNELIEVLKKLSPAEYSLFKIWFKKIIMNRFPKEHHREMEKLIDKTNVEQVGVMISGFEKNIIKVQEQGFEKGKKRNAVKIAKRMITKGVPLEEIADITELSIDELKELANKMD
ncbi:Rpn family recombination-promoting nuclease/putative transposase [Virgibacillus natechei]|uniref:Rpn family recombination-promoting nuclease/putative transposase n=1 Tax=Virgibacillus sp. CBA3643 TaxID=2942278 RepID=UPI0035A2E291